MNRVIITGWERGFQKISLSRLMQSVARYSMSASKHAVDDVLEGRTVSIEFGSLVEAEQFAAEVRGLKAICEVVAE